MLRHNIYWRVTYWESVKKAKHSVICEEYNVMGLGEDDDALCFLNKIKKDDALSFYVKRVTYRTSAKVRRYGTVFH